MSEHYLQGYSAYWKGRTCPYAPGTYEARRWQDGWAAAKRDDERWGRSRHGTGAKGG